MLERLVRVMRRLHPEKTFLLTVSPPGLILAMEQQDVEETVGNLLDNAARYATEQVHILAQIAPEGVQGKDPGRRNWIVIEVDDDGPGLEPEQIGIAIKRGKRLDESKPGTGLGIVDRQRDCRGISRHSGIVARRARRAESADRATRCVIRGCTIRCDVTFLTGLRVKFRNETPLTAAMLPAYAGNVKR